jgi:predicted secreted protein
MKTNTKLDSVLASAALILFLILVSLTASAAIAQNASPTTETRINNSDAAKALTTGTKELSGEAEREINLKNVTNSTEYTNVTSQILPTSFLVRDSTNNKTVVTALRPKY